MAKSNTVELGPVGWQAALPIFLAAYENGTAEGRKMAKEELRKMAKIADGAVVHRYRERGEHEKADRYEEAAGLRKFVKGGES